jgi:glycosyltransferase involved in cell wall biosynthesis
MTKNPLPTIGIYATGSGTGGEWRNVHSILSAIDLSEFRVVLFSDLRGPYLPRTGICVDLADEPPSRGRAFSKELSRLCRWRRRWFRQVFPEAVRYFLGYGRTCLRLSRRFRRYPIDLLHTHIAGCIEESPVAARLAGISRVIGTFHVDPSYDELSNRNWPGSQLVEYVSNHCLDLGIGVSRATTESWAQHTSLPRKRTVTIYNGISPERFRRRSDRPVARAALGLPSDERCIIGGVGRLHEQKGFRFLLDAMARLRNEFPNLLLVLAGSGPQEGELRRQAVRLGLAERVRFLGFRQDVQTVLDALDVFALPSLCETFGYALIEAMATCLPAVGFDVGGVPEIIVQGQTGFVVPARDPEKMAKALRTLLRSAELRQQFGEAARDRVVKHFREQDMVSRTIKLYRELLASREANPLP